MVDVGPAEFFWLDQEWQGCSFSHTAHCHHGRRWREQQWLFCLNYYLLMCTHIRNNVLSHSFDQSFCSFFFLSYILVCAQTMSSLLTNLFASLFFSYFLVCVETMSSLLTNRLGFEKVFYILCVCVWRRSSKDGEKMY